MKLHVNLSLMHLLNHMMLYYSAALNILKKKSRFPLVKLAANYVDLGPVFNWFRLFKFSEILAILL